MIIPEKLNFDLGALSPYISECTVDIHYHKHYAGYVQMTNDLCSVKAISAIDLPTLVRQCYGKKDLISLYHNAGQAFNHGIYFNTLSNQKTLIPQPLYSQIMQDFGTMENFHQQWQATGLTQFGSGWVWLVCNKDKKLSFITTANADSPLTQTDLTILAVLDVWEHAYYLDYQNRRADYLERIQHCLNWPWINQNLITALQKI